MRRAVDLAYNGVVIACRIILACFILVPLLAIGRAALDHGLPGLLVLAGGAWAVAALVWWARRSSGRIERLIARIFKYALYGVACVAAVVVAFVIANALGATAIGIIIIAWCVGRHIDETRAQLERIARAAERRRGDDF